MCVSEGRGGLFLYGEERKSWAKTPKVRESRCIDVGSDLILADALVKCKNGLSGGDVMSHTPGFLFAPSDYDIFRQMEKSLRGRSLCRLYVSIRAAIEISATEFRLFFLCNFPNSFPPSRLLPRLGAF